MSLIDEALKRAREQSGKPQAFPPAPQDPWFYAPLPQRRRPRAALAIGAAAGAIAVVAAIVFVVSRPRRATAPPDAGTEGVAARTPRPGGGETFPLALAPPTPGPPASLRRRDEGMSSLPSERAGMPPGAAGPAIGDARLASASPAIVAAAPPSRTLLSPPGAGAHPGERPRPSAAGARTYVGSLVAPDGARVELGGIVFSDTNPVALINGRVLPVGGVVEGLVIVAIEETRVELKGGGTTVFLALK